MRGSNVIRADSPDSDYTSFWADRAWSSLHPGDDERRRPLLAGELEYVHDVVDDDARRRLDEVAGDAEVVVVRYDMFLEGEPHLRGMVRNREIEAAEISISDGEDAVNRNFHEGPPEDWFI